jgi:hypothetical protein
MVNNHYACGTSETGTDFFGQGPGATASETQLRRARTNQPGVRRPARDLRSAWMR